jgi:predicted RNase H-like nuclease (RuvC/YqgF family)
LTPFSAISVQQAQNQKTPQPSVPQTNQQSSAAPSSRELAMLRAEVARLELLVKKLQTELQLEREYNMALEKQIHTLINSN